MKKLKFEGIIQDGAGYKASFASYLKNDFVERSMVIYLNDRFIIDKIYITSHEYGSAEWINGTGLIDCRLWETGDQAGSDTYLTRRYTVRLSNGPADNNYAAAMIIPDVLDNLADAGIALFLKKIFARKSSRKKFDLAGAVNDIQ